MDVIAQATLESGPCGHRWRVRCPFCRKTHTHGGGDLDEDPREYLGLKLAPCSGWEYLLEEEGSQSGREVADAGGEEARLAMI